MGSKIKQFILVVVVSFWCKNTIIAQDNTNKLPLVEIFQKLQDQYQIQFNYAEDSIENIVVEAPPTNTPLAEVLAYLQQRTGLNFELSNNNFVIVTKSDELILCGYILDKDNLSPLIAATVQGLKNSTISDDKGFFQLKAQSKNEEIIIRHLGYKLLTISYSNFIISECANVFLTPFFQSLEKVIIQNYIVKGINKLNNGSYALIFADFDILPGLIDADVLQSVQAFPGIQSINETVSNINIRGGTHDQNLILWDNIKMYQSGHFFGLISMYNPQITQKVSLFKNGSDVKFTDGVSGTIAMETDKILNTEFKGNIGVNLIDVNGFADVPLGRNSSIQIAARKAISDFVETPTYNKFFDRISQDTEVAINGEDVINSDKSFDFYDASLRWIYKITDSDELRLNFITVDNELRFDENAVINEDIESRTSSLSQNSIAGALYYNRIWNDKWQSSFEAYETDYALKAVNENVLDAQRFLQENKVSETSLKLIVKRQLNDRFHIKTGYHFVETEVTNLDDVDVPLYLLKISEVLRTHAAFSQLVWKSSDNNTSLNVGLRYNYLDKFKKHIWEPRLSLSHKFMDDFSMELLGEFKHQNTSQVINFQNDFLGIEKRRWQLSNDMDIPVITSKQISLNLNFDNDGWLLSAEGYYKMIDGITTQSQGFQNQYEFVKTDGSYEAFGIDFLLRKSLNNLSSWLSYSLLDDTYEFNDLPEISFPSNFDITHAITIATSYKINNLKIAAGLNWHSGRPFTQPESGNEILDDAVNFEPTNSSKLPEYLRVDISALYDFSFGKMTKANVGIAVWNILNKENVINNFYQIDNDVLNISQQKSLGLTPNVVFRVFF